MERRADIQDELKALGSSLPADIKTEGEVPDFYFTDLSSNIIANIKEELPFGIYIPSAMKQDVPTEYFEQLAENVLDLVKPVETSLKKTNTPFSVPDRYFEQLPQAILAKAKAETKLPDIEKGKTYQLPVWKKVCVAAASVIFFLAGVLSFHQELTSSSHIANTYQELADVPVASVNEYIANNIDEFDSDNLISLNADFSEVDIINSSLTDEDINRYINEVNTDDI